MLEVIFLLSLGLIAIIFATVEDLKKSEISNWINFSLIIFALGFRFFYSLFSLNDFNFFYQGLIGLGIFFVLGNFLYYGHVFAGGDAKLMIALGAILPLSLDFSHNLNIFFLFLLLFLFSGALYGIIMSTYLCIKNLKDFKKEFNIRFKENKRMVIFSLFFVALFVFLSFYEQLLIYLALIVFVLPYFYIASKSIDQVSMVKEIKPKELTEGDWLYKDVKIGKKTIKANWDGLTKKDIELIKKHKKSIVVRRGIPFTPVFLCSFLILSYLIFNGINNLFYLFI